jgi:thiol-disulfide isomerase/thioredoxin
MSAPPKDSRDAHVRSGAARRRAVAVWASVAGAIIIVAIIAYAVLQGNKTVPGSAVAPTTQDMPPPLRAGSRAPSFALRSGIGTFSSQSLAGTPYLLEIFATWCPHCQRMTKVLRQLRERVPESKLSMLSVTGSPYAANSTPDNLVPENQGDVDRFDNTFGITWPTFLDSDLVVAHKFGLDGFPTIFIVDKKGTIVYATSGEVPVATLMGAVRGAGT